MKRIIIFIVLLFVLSENFGQDVSIVTKTNGENTIELKWYGAELTYNKGVSVYRKTEDSDWVLLTPQPLTRGDDALIPLLDKDAQNLASGLKDNWNPKGIMLLNCFVKSFVSEDFARYLGIYFKDEKVEPGKKYQYKIVGAGNKEVVQSGLVLVEKNELTPPKEISIQLKKRDVSIFWQPEEKRYFGVNIYRKQNDSDFVLLNQFPIMPSKSNKEGKEYPEKFYMDESIEGGNTYTYYLKAIDFFGVESVPSESFTIEIADTVPPMRPFGLEKVDVKKQTVELKWKNALYVDAVGLNIYRGLYFAGEYVKINEKLLSVTDTSYVDEVPEALDYYYYVTSVDASGNEAPSGKIIVNVEDVVAPEKPIGLVAVADTGKVNLFWSANTESDLKGYLIYRTINSDSEKKYTLLNSDPVTDTFFTDIRPVRAKNKFAYKIVAIDSAFNTSKYSEAVLVSQPDVIAPAAPVIKNAIVADKGIRIEWIRNAETDLGGYFLYRKIDSARSYQSVNKERIASTSNSFYDSLVTSFTTYNYHLIAVDTSGHKSGYSNVFTVSTKNKSTDKQELLVKWKYKKKKQSLRLDWSKNELPESLIGYVVMVKKEGKFVQETGVIKQTKHELSTSSINAVKITAYLKNGVKISSSEIQP